MSPPAVVRVVVRFSLTHSVTHDGIPPALRPGMTYAGLLRKALPPPVFVDLVWERHRSPLVAALTTLRFLGFIYLTLVVNNLVDASKYCADYRGASMPGSTQDSLAAALAVFVLSSALASCRANSSLWVPVAVVSGLAYLAVLGSQEFTHCVSLMQAGIGDTDGITVVATATIDLVFSVLTVVALVWWAHDEWMAHVAAAGAQPLPVTDVAPPAPVPPPVGALGKVLHGLRVAPLRHHIAAALAFTFCLTATIAIAILGQQQADVVVTQWWNPFVEQFNELVALYDTLPLPDAPGPYNTFYYFVPGFVDGAADIINSAGAYVTISILEALYSTVIGASIACVVAIASMSWSYHIICDDFVALDAWFTAHPGVVAEAAADPTVAAMARDASDRAAGLLSPLSQAEAGAKADAGGARVEPGAPGPGCCSRPNLFLDSALGGTPDVSSPAYTYFNAFTYASLYAIK